MRRIGIVLGISLIAALLGVGAFAYGSRYLGQGQTSASVTYGALQSAAAPSAPGHLRAVVKGSEIDLTWDAAKGAETYNVYRGTGSHGEGTKPYVAGVVTLFFHNQQHIDPKATYFYIVTAVSHTGQESAPSNEASASLTPTAPVTVASHQPRPLAMNYLPVFVILGILLLAAGVFLLLRSRAHPSLATTTHLRPFPTDAAYGDPAASVGRMPVRPDEQWGDHSAAAPPFDDEWDDAYSASGLSSIPSPNSAPTPGLLPANTSVEAGLVARYGSATPEEVVADSGPLKALMPEPGDEAWRGDTGDVPSLRGDAGRYHYDASGQNPAWPVQRPRDYTTGEGEPDSRRTLLLIGAGASFVLGVMALFLFLFFNFFASAGATTNSTRGAPLPTTTAATATALPSPTATVPPTAVVAISSGGSGTGAFSADMDVSGGSTSSTTDPIDLSGVQNPAPEAVYQSERYGNFTYTIGGLTANGNYTVRLHFAEIYFKDAGKRIFDVFINGQQVLANFDIVATVGAPDKALVKTFTATADANGQIVIEYRNGPQNNAKSSGIEIIPAG